jgi:hypothetical protein
LNFSPEKLELDLTNSHLVRAATFGRAHRQLTGSDAATRRENVLCGCGCARCAGVNIENGGNREQDASGGEELRVRKSFRHSFFFLLML